MRKKNKIDKSGRFIFIKLLITRFLCSSSVGKCIGIVFQNRIPHRGSKIQVPSGGDPRVNASLYWGTYESAEIRFIRKFLTQPINVIELGSSIGGVSCEILKQISPSHKLVSVEANPNITAILKTNLDFNFPNNQTVLIHAAISYSEGDTVSYSLGKSNLSSRIGTSGNVQNVPTITLSKIVNDYMQGPYALISDIEGAEVQILANDKQALNQCSLMIIELHDCSYNGIAYTPEDLIIKIEKLGLKLLAQYGCVCAFSRLT